jgi:Family of unknown function (DUF6325)
MDVDVLAPIAYLAVEFPTGRVTGEGFSLVHNLVAGGTIAVMDLEFIAKATDGSVTTVRLEEIAHDSDVDITQWQGAYSGLLDEDDVRALAAAAEPGSLIGIIVYENVWAAPLLRAIDANGARLVGAGSVDADDVITALDSSSPA